jgi:hypothetical protein
VGTVGGKGRPSVGKIWEWYVKSRQLHGCSNEIMHMFAASGVYIQMSLWPPPFMMMEREGCGAALKMTLS